MKLLSKIYNKILIPLSIIGFSLMVIVLIFIGIKWVVLSFGFNISSFILGFVAFPVIVFLFACIGGD